MAQKVIAVRFKVTTAATASATFTGVPVALPTDDYFVRGSGIQFGTGGVLGNPTYRVLWTAAQSVFDAAGLVANRAHVAGLSVVLRVNSLTVFGPVPLSYLRSHGARVVGSPTATFGDMEASETVKDLIPPHAIPIDSAQTVVAALIADTDTPLVSTVELMVPCAVSIPDAVRAAGGV